jgi:hypothetical protein
MKNWISKVLLYLAVIFFAIAIYIIRQLYVSGIFLAFLYDASSNLMWILLLTASGIFLALYRIINILENK